MKCRAIKNGEVVWFGRVKVGDNIEVYDSTNPTNSYDTKQQAIASSITERLSILKRELWYRVSYGLPLFDKTKSKALIDAYIASVITSVEGVVRFESFSSTLSNGNYHCETKIVSEYGVVNFQI